MPDVRNTDLQDLEQIFGLFEHSIDYQEKNGYPVWRNYDRNAIVRDIESKSQYKVVADSAIALVFSVSYTDKIIWREMDQGSSVYLHRIVVNPAFKGRKLFARVLDWSIRHAKEKSLDTVRMDTWANNPVLISYYRGFGFSIVENFTTPDSPDLPKHNRNLALTLLEYRVALGEGGHL